MLEKIAQHWSEQMIDKGVIERERAPLYCFGMEQGMRTLLEILLMLVTGVLLGLFWQGLIMMCAFCFIRIYAGGYHAKTPMQCAIKSWIMFTAFLLWLRYVPENLYMQIGTILVTGVVLFFLCPLPDDNKPLQDYEIAKYRKRSFILYGVEVVIYLMGFFVSHDLVARSIVCGMGMLLVVWGIYVIKRIYSNIWKTQKQRKLCKEEI